MKPSQRKMAVNLTASLACTAECAYRELSRGACVVPHLTAMRELVRALEQVEEGKK